MTFFFGGGVLGDGCGDNTEELRVYSWIGAPGSLLAMLQGPCSAGDGTQA